MGVLEKGKDRTRRTRPSFLKSRGAKLVDYDSVAMSEIGADEVFQIKDLREDPKSVSLISSWNEEYWRPVLPELTIREWTTFYNECLDAAPDSLPQVLLGYSNGELVGTIALVDQDDVKDYPYLTPWIACLVIKKEERGQHLGQFLVDAMRKRAEEMGFSNVYLWTESRGNWYRRNGWSTLHKIVFHGYPAEILTLALHPQIHGESETITSQ